MFELESVTTAPPERAGAVNVTVPVPVCPPTMVPGFTVTLLSAADGGSEGLMVMLALVLTPA